jgi:flagellar hook-basal body complex protein FliE
MAIGPIGPQLPAQPGFKLDLLQPGGGGGAAQGAQGPAAAANAFSSLLNDAVGNIDKLQKTADANVQKMATGQPVDLHDLSISMEQSSLSFQLGMQARNKLIEAYQEVMRMQV